MEAFSVFVAQRSSDEDYFLVHAPGFYEVFKQDNRVPAVEGEATVLDSNTVLSLLAAIGKKGRKNILIVSHGSPNGLILSIGNDKGLYPWMRMVLLLHMALIKSYYEEAEVKDQELRVLLHKKHLENWYKVYAASHPTHRFDFLKKDQQEPALRSLNGPIQSADLLQLIGDVEAIDEEPLEGKHKKLEEKLKSVKAAVKTRMDWILKNLAMDDREVQKYIDALKAVHSVGLQRVEVRGCNVGKSPPTMQVLCTFLGASSLRAPDVADYFAEVIPNVEPAAKGFSKREKGDASGASPSTLKRVARFNLSGKTKLPAGWRFEVAGLGAAHDELYFNESFRKKNTYMLAESINVVQEFVRSRMGIPQHGIDSVKVGQPFPAQFLETAPPYFPLEHDFEKHLKSVAASFKANLSDRKIDGLK